ARDLARASRRRDADRRQVHSGGRLEQGNVVVRSHRRSGRPRQRSRSSAGDAGTPRPSGEEVTIARRWVIALAVLLVAVVGPALPALADTTATTGITVTTQDVGRLAIAFGQLDDGYVFRNADGSANLSVSAISGDTGTATVRVIWNDTRGDETRLPFRISL